MAELPLSLKNLAIENIAISECSDTARLFEAKSQCYYDQTSKTVCFRGMDNRRIRHSRARLNRTTELILCHWPWKSFDPKELTDWTPNLEKLSIMGENLWMLKADFPPLPNLRAINITGTKLNFTRVSTFRELPALRQLNMRGNALVQVVPYQFESDHVDVFLHGRFCERLLLQVCFLCGTFLQIISSSSLQVIPGTAPTT